MNFQKFVRPLFLAGFAWLLPGQVFSQTDTPFVSLFNGTDLTGWTTKSAGTAVTNFATVHDGYMHLESPGGTGWLWLYSEKPYTDFVMKLKFSAPSGNQGNSGVNFRSSWDANDSGGFLNGPQVDIYTFNNWRTGCILDMTKNSQRWFFPDLPNWNIARANVTTPAGWKFNTFPDWNDLEIQVKGMTVKTIVNGIPFGNFNGEGVLNDALHKSKNVGSTGYIALQAHAQEKVLIYFKDIKIADMTAVSTRQALKPMARNRVPNRSHDFISIYSLDGKRRDPSAKGAAGWGKGLSIVKQAGMPRLQADIQ